jgi:hypothetical protein
LLWLALLTKFFKNDLNLTMFAQIFWIRRTVKLEVKKVKRIIIWNEGNIYLFCYLYYYEGAFIGARWNKLWEEAKVAVIKDQSDPSICLFYLLIIKCSHVLLHVRYVTRTYDLCLYKLKQLTSNNRTEFDSKTYYVPF